jgi:Putative  PD-(D/E)XK family member, (DUF4420)
MMTLGVTKMADDPWEGLEPPPEADVINARRVDASLPWNFYWARSADRRCLLILGHKQESAPQNRLPVIKGVEVSLSESDQGGQRMLTLKLHDSAQRDIFHQLCLDIVGCASRANSEREVVELTLARTWRWHHLLRGGTSQKLSPDEQKGMIGEMAVLEDLLLPHLSPFDSVAAWRGPLGAPKDFEIGRVCVEAKARRGAAEPFVMISSEHQLDLSGTDALFLHVVELAAATDHADSAFSVAEMASRLHHQIAAMDASAADHFDALLAANGLNREDDYSDCRWVRGPDRLYRVADAFPSVTPGKFPSGVSGVRYAVSLPDCEPWRVSNDDFRAALAGVSRVD